MMMHEQGREIDLLKQERQNNERRLRSTHQTKIEVPLLLVQNPITNTLHDLLGMCFIFPVFNRPGVAGAVLQTPPLGRTSEEKKAASFRTFSKRRGGGQTGIQKF